MKNFIKKPISIVSAIVLLALLLGGYFYFSPKKPVYEFVVVKKGDVIQEVSVTGHVKPAEKVDLAFEKVGKVVWIGVEVGDKVFPGQILIQIANADLVAQLNQAEANIKAQKAKLEELKKGTRPEEIQVYEVKVENAKTSLEDAKKNLADKLEDAYTKADDAIRNKIDQFFNNPRTSQPQINFTLADSQLKTDIEWGRFVVEGILTSWNPIEADKNLNQISSFLDKISLAVNSLTANTSLSQTTIDTWKADVFTARTNVNTAINNLSVAEEKLKTAESNLTLAENELALKKAGTVAEQITNQEAQVEQAEANVKNIQAQIEKTIIRSPLKGIVIKKDVKVGEIVSANTTAISVMSEAQFEIEANVPEADVAKVKINDSAKVTLDAYGNDIIFEAKVIKIDPAETIIEGVATYKTTLQFINEDNRIKSGMTANIDILTAKRENAIIIPQRAVVQKNGDKIVKILKDDGSLEERKVIIGLKGSDGNIEIIEGINEGDKVIYGSY